MKINAIGLRISIFAFVLLVTGTVSAQDATDAPKPAAPSTGTADTKEPQLQFSFEGEDWKTVFDWLAENADLQLTHESLPPGKFNFSDSRSYTPTQAIEIINSWLVARNYVLIKNRNQLVVLNLENEIPQHLIQEVGLEGLDKLGSYEFARCTFAPKTLTTDQIEEEFKALLGEYGTLYVLPNTGRIVVSDMVSQLRTMKSVLGDLETGAARTGVQAKVLPLNHITTEEAMGTIRQIFQIPEDLWASEDGDLRFSVDPTGRKLIIRSKPDKFAAVEELVKLIDNQVEGAAGEELADPVFKSYSIRKTEPTLVLRVMQTMLAGQLEVRLDVSEETKTLYALARPEDQERIQRTLDNMQGKADQIKVFSLDILDADIAKTRIDSLLVTQTSDEEGNVTATEGPTVIADATGRRLIVRGSPDDMQGIGDFLVQMGESADGAESTRSNENIRVVPMDGVVTGAVIERALELWPSMRSNEIQVIMPKEDEGLIRTESLDQIEKSLEDQLPSRQQGGQGVNEYLDDEDEPPADGADVRVSQIEVPSVTFLAQVTQTNPTENSRNAGTGPAAGGQPDAAAPKPDGKPKPKILITPGSGGVVIASDDLEALDEFEDLVRLLSDPYLFPASDVVVFPLKYEKAEQAKALLDELLGNSDSGGGGGGGALGGLMGGGLMGGLMGGAGDLLGGLGGGGITTVGPVTITTNGRLNLLFVQADPVDVGTVKQLIEIIDQPESPIKVETSAIPRVIPLKRAAATELVNVLKEAFPSQGGSGGGGGGGGGGNQAEQIQKMIQQIAGRGGGGGGGDSGPEISITADARSNSLIVVAPDQIYEEIEKLALFLDESATDSEEITVVVPVSRANAESVQTALEALYGAAAGAQQGAAGGSAQGGSRPGQQSGGQQGAVNADQMRAIQERIRQFREAAGGGGRGGGGRGGAGGGGRGGGGGGRGGGGGGRGGGR